MIFRAIPLSSGLLSRCLLSAALGVAAVGGSLHATDAQARVRVGIDVHVAPPPLRHERVVVRPGYVYRPARWEPHGRQWRFHSGYWSRH